MIRLKSHTVHQWSIATGACFLLNLLLFSASYSQEIEQGSWRTHFSYQNARIIENTGTKIFCAVENGLFYIDTSDNTVNTLSKIDGFSDVTISSLGYSEATNTLVIGYENGNIDLFSGNGITNIDLVKTQNIIQDKTIRHISINGDIAYLSTDFGIVVIDLNRELIDEVYREIGPDGVQPAVAATAVFQDSIFAPTSAGLLKARLDDNINLLDFNNWQVANTPLATGTLFNQIASSESLYLTTDNEVYAYTAGLFTSISSSFAGITRIRAVDNSVLLVNQGTAYELDNDVFIAINTPETSNLKDVLPINDDFWLADGEAGLARLRGTATELLSPNGPLNDNIQKLVYQRDSLYAFGPYRTDNFAPLDQSGYATFSSGQWDLVENTSIRDASDVNGSFLASYSQALTDRASGQPVQGSPLLPSETINDATIVSDLASNAQGLWVANRGTSLPLHLLSQDGSWQSFELGGLMDNIEQIAASGQIWMREHRSTGVTVFDPESGAVSRSTANNSDLPSSRINDIAIDQDDEVWVATANGVAFYPAASLELSEFNTAIVPVFENNFLFREEVINCITVDPGNRKWFGNTTGAWLLEEAGESLVLQFNVDNSPLPSNNVLDIAINPISGEVFIATDKGMVSYRSDATTGAATHADVKIFPNPVRPGFSGMVGINGLAADVRLKITDVSGKLIREIEANGGGASWNLQDINGNRAKTGIYLVFSSDSEGVETFVGKFAIIN